MNTGDTAFILIATAMILFMTPGLAFFYGGMVRRKNVLNTIMASFFIIGLASVMWVLVGYSLSFGKSNFGLIGNFQWLGFNEVSWEPNVDYAENIPHNLFASFQMMFAIITPAIITGAVVERIKFSALFIFVMLWLLIVYYPLAHMTWGVGGVLRELGAIDFAGGNVVHISSGISAFVASIVIGKRKGLGMTSYHPHNIPLVVLGASILWFGWFGFNGGSALGASGLAVHALLTTNTSAASAMLSWMLIEGKHREKPTLLGAATGGIVGLVAITPGAGFVPIWASFIIGFLASPICYFALTTLKSKLGYDDALDAFGCHGIGGIWGGLATGIFANESVNSSLQWNGLVFGETNLIVAQIISIVITILIALIGTTTILVILRKIITIRVSQDEELKGLDISEHRESAYPAFQGMD